uniref:Uncharacterized protein n=1 Tax=Parastrongyloides trichosuri TaxID=131310 RepID=A0A0N4ZWU8_PARTI
MLHFVSYVLIFVFTFVSTCAGKKKKNVDGANAKIVRTDANISASKAGNGKEKVSVPSTANTTGTTQVKNETETKGQTGQTVPQKSIHKSKGEKKTLLPKKSIRKEETPVNNQNKVAATNNNSTYNCQSAAPTQLNIFEQNINPTPDQVVVEKTQDTFIEELKDGDDTLKNVYSLPPDEDKSVKVADAGSGKKSIAGTNKKS